MIAQYKILRLVRTTIYKIIVLLNVQNVRIDRRVMAFQDFNANIVIFVKNLIWYIVQNRNVEYKIVNNWQFMENQEVKGHVVNNINNLAKLTLQI